MPACAPRSGIAGAVSSRDVNLRDTHAFAETRFLQRKRLVGWERCRRPITLVTLAAANTAHPVPAPAALLSLWGFGPDILVGQPSWAVPVAVTRPFARTEGKVPTPRRHEHASGRRFAYGSLDCGRTQKQIASYPGPHGFTCWRDLIGRTRSSGVNRLVLVGAALVAALALDWFVVPWSYPVAAAYGVSLLLAARVLPPRAVVVTTFIALVMSAGSNNLQGAPAAAWVADDTGLVLIGLLAWLLARERETARRARQSSEVANRRIELAYGAARALAEATALEDAGTSILASLGRHLGWACGAMWFMDEATGGLVSLATWHNSDGPMDAFERQTRSVRMQRGVGLPGRVWATGEAVWVPDVQGDPGFARREAPIEVGLHAGFGFPIKRAGTMLGVIEFFDTRPRARDEDLLDLMDALGAQIGLFLARRQAEAQAAALLASEHAARVEADTAVRVRDEFLASVAHDLRGPLSAILGYAALARKRLESDTERAADALREVQASVGRLSYALDELLDLAQLQAGQPLNLRRQLTDLVTLTKRIAREQEIATEGCFLRVLTDVPAAMGSWDEARLERALGNVIGNAVKYSPRGSEITVRISVEQHADAGFGVVEVSDKGIGIPTADLPHVFRRFHRAANVAATVPGTGLGLPGAGEIVRQHGGRISVVSQEGHGSVFTIRLPLDKAAPEAQPTSAPPSTETQAAAR